MTLVTSRDVSLEEEALLFKMKKKMLSAENVTQKESMQCDTQCVL